jgi:hypothetical protein
MKSIKPYLFWLVIGVVCVVVIGAGVTLRPASTKGDSVQKVTEKLNSQYKKLEALAIRAREEISSYPTTDPAIFDQLRDDYMVTKRWESGLDRLKRSYVQQQEDIVRDLLQRSESLLDPISESTEQSNWYFAYEDKTASWLQRLHREGLIALPASFQRLTATGIQTEVKIDDFKTRGELRSAFGLFTLSGTEYPKQQAWPALTLQFRALELISDCLRQAKATSAANAAMIDLVPPPLAETVQMQGLSWSVTAAAPAAARDAQPPAESPIPGGLALECTLKVSGSPSALLALSAALDAQVQPMVVVRGVTWRQVLPNVQSEVNEADTAFAADYSLAFLRFTKAGLEAIAGKPKTGGK